MEYVSLRLHSSPVISYALLPASIYRQLGAGPPLNLRASLKNSRTILMQNLNSRIATILQRDQVVSKNKSEYHFRFITSPSGGNKR